MNSTNESKNAQSVILAVDDNPRNLQLISSLLSSNNYKVVVANSGENALKYMALKEPDLLLLDVMMPGLSGYEVCEQIKLNPRWKELPIIFLTAKSDLNDIVTGFKLGAVDYITKPFKGEEVLARVQTHIDLKNARNQLISKNAELELLTDALKESNKTIQDDALRLEKLNAEKDKFFSIIAHDLRGPFSGCLAATDILTNNIQSLSKEEIVGFASALSETAAQLNKLLENLLSWAQVQMGSFSLNQENILINDILEETIHAIKKSASIKEIELNFFTENAFHVFTDRNMVESILRNLLSNAVKFTPLKGKIDVNIFRNADENFTIVEIKDNGMGMNPELLSKLFKINENVSRPGTAGETSTGLGLMLSSDLAQRMGGKIEVESEEFKGSTFRLILPSASA
ncbi:MAG: hybrid sensor histidine kinase/response regulator [Bacteroidetes bacterium]|jgi:two-component system, sensor histidine kinase and response regulator|nr:hybrid sensor histidine kinase/response regulator [Bacteroidota bacterium]